MKRWAVAVLLPFLMSGGPVPAQQLPPARRVAAVPDELVARPVTIRRDIGQAHDGVSTTSAQAQAFYDQGLAYLHSHVWIEAARSFNQALRLDPSLAMGHLGMTVTYAAAAPAVPHAQHVHGHVLRRVGRIEDALRAVESADRLESAYFQAEQTPPEHEWHYEHNLDLLGATYRYLGRMREAEAALKRAFAVPSSLLVQMLEKREWPAFLVSRGRTAEAEAAARVLIADASSLVRAAGHVAAGQAMLAAGRTQAAANEASAALRELGGAPREATLVARALEALQGELLLRTGQWEKGRAMLDEVARRVREDREPDNWAQALFMLEAIAKAAREVGDWDFAGFAARQMLAHDPSSGSTHYALGLVAEHNGDVRAAQAEFALVRKYWANADPDLPELRAVQRKGR